MSDRTDRKPTSQETRAPRMGEPGWFPDHSAERRAEFARTTPAERVEEAIRLSETATRLAAAAAAWR